MPKETKRSRGLCTSKRCENRTVKGSIHCRECLAWIAAGKPCRRCGKPHGRSGESVCSSCRTYGPPATRLSKVMHYRTDEGSYSPELRKQLEADPARLARIAKYTERAALGLPLFDGEERMAYIRSLRRRGGTVKVAGDVADDFDGSHLDKGDI